MPITDNLNKLLDKQKEVNQDLEKEIKNLESNDLLSENDKLKKELSECQIELETEKSANKKINEENKSLKNALYEQIYNEKLSILNATSRKLDVYFKLEIGSELNRLTAFELHSKNRINNMTNILKQNRIDSEDEIYKKLNELSDLLNNKVTIAREEVARQKGVFSEDTNKGIDALKQEQISEEDIKGILKKNNIESLIGLNIINKLGILLLVIGVITALQFTYFKLPDILKSIFAFVLGGGLLVTGEILNRKKSNVFSLGITSGGVAVLYVALAISYFGLKTLDMYPALALCVLITAVSFVLSQRYNSQTIASFALIGGYLPILSIATSKALIYSVMMYFVILNLLALIISANKKWPISQFLGFCLNVVGTIYIMIIMLVYNGINNATSFDDFILILYITFAFIIYTLIPLLSVYIHKLKLKDYDIVLLGLNTVISAILMYIAFYSVGLKDFTGLLAIIFAITYLTLGKFIETRLTQEKKTQKLFYLTGLTFVVLIIPFQFGKIWLSLGWLVEGVVLATYGTLKKEKGFQKAGLIIYGLCLAAFIIFDVPVMSYYGLFVYKYSSITLGSIIILTSYAYKKSLVSDTISYFKYGTLVNFWIFGIYIVGNRLAPTLTRSLSSSELNAEYLISALKIVVSLFIAYGISNIKILLDNTTKYIFMGIYIINIWWLLCLNSSSSIVIDSTKAPLIISIVGTVILVIIGLISVLAVRNIMLWLIAEQDLGIEWYPFIVSAYFVILLTQNLIVQYNLAFTNASISIIYVVTALAWIIFGFIKKYVFIRKFGLGLSIFAVAKLFIFDLSFLTQGFRIVSYFAFGITLIAISFVYQHYNKRLEIKGEVIDNDK